MGPQTVMQSHNEKEDPIALIIDDEDSVRDAVRDILELIDIKSITAPDGSTGLTEFKHHQGAIKIILLDLSMPGMSGEETFRTLRKIEPMVWIVITTGLSKSDVPPLFTNDAYTKVLSKPFSIDSLLTLVEELLNK